VELASIVAEVEYVEMAQQLRSLVLGADLFGWIAEILEVIHKPA